MTVTQLAISIVYFNVTMKSSTFHYVLLVLRLTEGMFTVQPSTVVLPVGAHAQFQCQHLDAITLTWSIGGVFLYQYHPPNVTTTVFLQVNTLTIPGLVQYNGTAIQCKAIFNLATDDHELSNIAYLQLHGKRKQPHFAESLNTTVPVNEYGTTDFTLSGNRNESIYTTTSQALFGGGDTCSRNIQAELSPYPVTMQSNSTFPNMKEDVICSLYLIISDVVVHSKRPVLICFVQYEKTCTVLNSNCTQLLQHNRKYSSTARCHGMENWTYHLSLLISTHDIQKLEVVANSSMVEITCHYAASNRASTAVGCFVMVLYWDRAIPPKYRAVYKTQLSDDQTIFNIDVSVIKSISVYDMESNLLPGRYTADTVRFHSNLDSENSTTGKMNESTTMERMEEESVLLSTDMDEICLTTSTRMRRHVMVYHKLTNIDQYTDSEVILLIAYASRTDVYQPSRSCHQVSPGDYSVAVFDLDADGRMNEHPTRVAILRVNDNNAINQVTNFEDADINFSNQTLIVGTVVAVGNLPNVSSQSTSIHTSTHNAHTKAFLVLGCVITVIATSTLMYKCHLQLPLKYDKSSGDISEGSHALRMQRCEAYESVVVNTKRHS